jgi:hypothetical protein
VNSKENLLRVIHHDHPEWVPDGLEAVVTLQPPLDERPAIAGLDPFGVHWSYEEEAEGGTFPTEGGHTISDLALWRAQITIPDVDSLDWQAVEEKARAIDRTQYLVQGFVHMGPFERSYLLLGMQEALVGYMTEPDQMSALLAAIVDFKLALIERFHAVAHLDMLHFGDDWGMQDRLFLPPAVWRRVVKPQVRRVYDWLKGRGVLINHHSCGQIEAILGDMVEMGVDIWNPCQPCNDLAQLKRQYGGRITFFGGLDSQFVLGRPGVTPEEVRAEVRRRIDELAAGGGYIAAPSHALPYDPALVAAMKDEIAVYGRPFYRLRACGAGRAE